MARISRAFSLTEFSELVSNALEIDSQIDSALVFPTSPSPSPIPSPASSTPTASATPIIHAHGLAPRVLRKIKSILQRNAPSTRTPSESVQPETPPSATIPTLSLASSPPDAHFVPFLPYPHRHETDYGVSIFSRHGSDGGSSIVPPSSDSGHSAESVASSACFPPTPPQYSRRLSLSSSSDCAQALVPDADPFAKGQVQVVRPYTSPHPAQVPTTRSLDRPEVNARPPPDCPLPALPRHTLPSPPLTPEVQDWTLSLPFGVPDSPRSFVFTRSQTERRSMRSREVKNLDVPAQPLVPMGIRRRGSPFPFTIKLPPKSPTSGAYPSPGLSTASARTPRTNLPPPLPPPTCDLPALPPFAHHLTPPSTPASRHHPRSLRSVRSAQSFSTTVSDPVVILARRKVLKPCKMVRCDKTGLPIPSPWSSPTSIPVSPTRPTMNTSPRGRGRSGSMFTVHSAQSSKRSGETEYYSVRDSLDGA